MQTEYREYLEGYIRLVTEYKLPANSYTWGVYKYYRYIKSWL